MPYHNNNDISTIAVPVWRYVDRTALGRREDQTPAWGTPARRAPAGSPTIRARITEGTYKGL